MAPPKKSWLNSGAHFCASCLVTVACWALWIVLGITLVALAYVALARELRVPDFVLRRVEARLADSGLALQFGRAHFDPAGRILLEDVRFRSAQFEDPLLTCRLLYIRHDFWSMMAGRHQPAEVHVEGAALHLPAMLSPSGTTEAIVSDLAATVRYDHNAWILDQFAGRLGPLTLTVAGELPLPARAAAGAPPPLGDLAAAYLRSARAAAPLLRQLEAFDDPSLAIQLRPNRADLLFTAAGVRQPFGQPVTSGPLAAATTLRLGRAGARPARVHLSAAQVNYRGEIAIDQLRAVLRAEVLPESLTGRPLDVQVAAARVTAAGEEFIGPGLRADVSRWPSVTTRALAQVDGEFLAAEVAAELKEQSARVHAEGRVSPGLISRVLTEHTPRAAPYFVFGDPVGFRADAELLPGWKFGRVSSRVDARRLDSHGVQVTAARGRIDIVGTSFLAHDAYAEIGESHATGSYWMDFATTDYRMLLDGQLRPLAIAGWFRGDWWPAFWNRFFAFPGSPPAAAVDVQGRWRDPSLSNNFVVAHAGPVQAWNGDFEHVDATVFVRPNFAHAWALDGRRAGGAERITGSFKRFGQPASRETARFEFDFAGNPDPAVVARMLEGRADEALAPLRFSAPPSVHAWGAIENGVSDYRLTGETRGLVHYFGFPLDSVRIAGAIRGSDVQLDEITLSAAGGAGRGRASLTGPAAERRLGFEVFVNGANLGRAIHAFEEFDAARTGRPYVASADTKFVRKAAGSRLDVALSASGKPGDVASFKGSGNAAVTGAELGEVHLFGLLSQALSGLSLSFSSLKLDAARASFDVHDGAVFFPDLKVTGPSAVIDARGKYSFTANALDFNAKFKPYDQPGSLLAAAVSLVINPLTSILELKLSGPLANPKWSVNVTTPSSTPTTPASAKQAPAAAPAPAPAAAPAPERPPTPPGG